MNANLMSELIAQLGHSDPMVSKQANTALVEMGATVIKPLINAILEGSENLRWQAANVLFQLNDPCCIEPMLEALKSPNLMLEHIAVEALQQFDLSALVPALIQALPNSHCSVQARIVTLLESAGDQQAVEPLVKLLETTDSSLLRLSIIQALGTLGSVQVMDAIKAFLDDEDTHVQKRARCVMEFLEKKSQGNLS